MYLRTLEGLGLGHAPCAGSSSSYIGEPKLTSAASCALYERGEVERSHCQEGPCGQGHLVADVIRHPRGLLIADFGVGWSGIKAATRKEKLLQDWMAEARANLYSIILRIYGYTDCVGEVKHNVALRYARAEQVYKLLDKDLQSRVVFSQTVRLRLRHRSDAFRLTVRLRRPSDLNPQGRILTGSRPEYRRQICRLRRFWID